MTTPRLGAPELATSQTNKEETVNEAIRHIEAGAGHFIFIDRDLSDPTALSPVDGDCYLIASPGAGAWTGKGGQIAFRVNTAWAYIDAIHGFTAWVKDENVFVAFNGSTWDTIAAPSGVYLPITGGTLSGDLIVPDEAYDATAWNGSLEVPTKNAIRDKIETLTSGGYTPGGTDVALADGGTGASLADPGADRIMFWDDSAAAVDWLTVGSGLSISGTTITATAAGGGVQSTPILAAAMTPRTTNGAATGTTETTTNKIMLATLDFDQSTEEYAQFMFPMPKSWNESTVTAQFIWTAASGSGDVIWGIQGVAISNDDALDAAFGTAQEVTDTLLATNDQHTTSFTSAVTIGGTPAEGDLVCFQVYRKAANGGDTLNADAKLIGIRLNFTTNAADDS